jgi:hypothetical protein
MRRLLTLVRAARRKLVVEEGRDVASARDIFFSLATRTLLVGRGVIPDVRGSSTQSWIDEIALSLAGLPDFMNRAARQESVAFSLDADLVHLFESDPLSMGWAYQFWNEPERDSATTAIPRRGEDRAGHDEIAVTTQLFTEDYMSTFLAERCLSTEGVRQDLLSGKRIDCIDPACGVGHMLVTFLRTLCDIAEGGTSSSYELVASLYGCDIDRTAVEICRIILLAEVGTNKRIDVQSMWKVVCSNIQHLTSPWGTLDRVEVPALLRRSYDCVVTNPPYIGRRKLTEETRAYLDSHYPATSMDLCSAFMERCLEITRDGGMLGFVTVDKWLRLKIYEKLRTGGNEFGGLYRSLSLDVVCELGHRAFEAVSSLHDGVGICLMSARKQPPSADHTFSFISTTNQSSPRDKAARLRSWSETHGTRVRQVELLEGGRSSSFVLNHGVPTALRSSSRILKEVASVLVGLQTSDDRRFVRYVWSVPPDRSRWIVHSKGGGYDRWFGLNRYVLDWGTGRSCFAEDPKSGLGVESWFAREGWTYTWFANGALGLRKKEAGWSFGRAAAAGVFCDDPRYIGFLNSRMASAVARRIGGKAQLPEGVVRSLPIPSSLDGIDGSLIESAVELKRALVAHEPTEASFNPKEVWNPHQYLSLQAVLLVVEGILEQQVCDLLGLRDEERRDLDTTMGVPVAWHRRHECEGDDEIWCSLPSRFQGLRPIVEPFIRPSRGPSKSHPECSGYFESKRYSYELGRRLPATCLVESIGRAMTVHPFDVVRDVNRMLSNRPHVREYVVGPPLRARIVALALSELGHQWWGEGVAPQSRELQELSILELARRVNDVLPKVVEISQQLRDQLIGQPLAEWMHAQMQEIQLLMFAQTPLLVRAGGEALSKGSFHHVWRARDVTSVGDKFGSLARHSL